MHITSDEKKKNNFLLPHYTKIGVREIIIWKKMKRHIEIDSNYCVFKGDKNAKKDVKSTTDNDNKHISNNGIDNSDKNNRYDNDDDNDSNTNATMTNDTHRHYKYHDNNDNESTKNSDY